MIVRRVCLVVLAALTVSHWEHAVHAQAPAAGAPAAAPKPTPTPCPSGSAETECPTFIDFNVGVELLQSNEFTKTFPRVGFRFRQRFFDTPEYSLLNGGVRFVWFRPSLLMHLAMASRNIETVAAAATTAQPTANSTPQAGATPKPFKLEGQRTFEGHGGLLFDLVDFYAGDEPTTTIGLLAQLGVISPDASSSDLLQNHFGGLRFYYRGTQYNANGASLDIGWGSSENFQRNRDRRFKFRAYLPYSTTRGKLFAAVMVDSDFSKEADEMKLMFGYSVQLQDVFEAVGGLLPPIPQKSPAPTT